MRLRDFLTDLFASEDFLTTICDAGDFLTDSFLSGDFLVTICDAGDFLSDSFASGASDHCM